MNYGQQNTTLNIPPGGIRYVGDQLGSAPQVDRSVPIHEHLQELESKICRLHETIESLQNRLSCVSAPQPPMVEARDSVRHPGGSGMSVQLSGLIAGVDAAWNKLHLMYDALEI